MNHYDMEKWKSYKKDILEQDEKITMENHLYNCDKCMDRFLSLIDDEEIELADKNISLDFTIDTMKKIDKIVSTEKCIKKKKLIENIFMYYVAAASVILALTAGGMFTKLAQIPLENISFNMQENPKRIDKAYNLSEKLTNNTNDFINNFGIKQQGGK